MMFNYCCAVNEIRMTFFTEAGFERVSTQSTWNEVAAMRTAHAHICARSHRRLLHGMY